MPKVVLNNLYVLNLLPLTCPVSSQSFLYHVSWSIPINLFLTSLNDKISTTVNKGKRNSSILNDYIIQLNSLVPQIAAP